MKHFEDLLTWQRAMELTVLVHAEISAGKLARDRIPSDQIWRCTVSISSNIAEGFERFNRKEFSHFLSIAKGSCGELRSQIQVATRVGYVTASQGKALVEQANRLGQLIGALRTSLHRKSPAT